MVSWMPVAAARSKTLIGPAARMHVSRVSRVGSASRANWSARMRTDSGSPRPLAVVDPVAPRHGLGAIVLDFHTGQGVLAAVSLFGSWRFGHRPGQSRSRMSPWRPSVAGADDCCVMNHVLSRLVRVSASQHERVCWTRGRAGSHASVTAPGPAGGAGLPQEPGSGWPLDRPGQPGCTDVVLPEPAARPELPLACTLGPADGAERFRRWQQLAAAAAPTARLAGHRLEVRYRPVPGVLAELQSLAGAEAECCTFVEWAVTEQDGTPTLLVTARPDTPERIQPIAALFGAA